MTKLTHPDQQILTLRGRYAQIGVNYDKATRRLLGYRYVGPVTTPSEESPRTTIPVPSEELARLLEDRDSDLVSMGVYRWTVTGLEKVTA